MTLGPERAYGMTIHEEVERLSKRSIVSLGSIYTAVDRLEKKGFVTSRFAEATTDRGGRPRRYVEITAAGQRALRHALDQAAVMTIRWIPARRTSSARSWKLWPRSTIHVWQSYFILRAIPLVMEYSMENLSPVKTTLLNRQFFTPA